MSVPPLGEEGGRAPSIRCREATFEKRGRGGQLRSTSQKCIAKGFVVTDHPVTSPVGFAQKVDLRLCPQSDISKPQSPVLNKDPQYP